jgi:hypothetical protein
MDGKMFFCQDSFKKVSIIFIPVVLLVGRLIEFSETNYFPYFIKCFGS